MLFDASEMKNPILQNIFRKVKELKDVDLACAEYTLEVLDEIEFKDIPPKPEEVKEYEKIPFERRRTFTAVPNNIMDYYRLVDVVKRENGSIFEWLVFCMKKLRHKPEAALKIHNKIDNVTVDQVWNKGE